MDLQKDWDDALFEAACVGAISKLDGLLEIRGQDAPERAVALGRAASAAAARGNGLCLASLIKAGADIEHPDSVGERPLLRAAREGHLECVELLVKAGALVNAAAKTGVDALAMAALGGHARCLEALIDAGADLRALRGKASVLLRAVKCKEPTAAKCVGLLLEKGCDPNEMQGPGMTALMAACLLGKADLVELLLTHGARTDLVNDKGFTAMDLTSFDKEEGAACARVLEAWPARQEKERLAAVAMPGKETAQALRI